MSFHLSPEAIARYVQRRCGDLEVLKTACANEDFEKIKYIAHQLKGNASTFGFRELGERAIRMEDEAINQNAAAIREELDWMESWIKENLPTPGQSPRDITG